jgi:hypothetical protein
MRAWAFPVTLDGVMLVLIGLYALVEGTRGVISPRRSLERTYAWDRRWTRVFTFGLFDPKPRPVTDRAVRRHAVVGVVLVVAGLAMLFFGVRLLLA